jgi:TRAP-type C4-dicarboxylate transport system permease small subunit
MAKKKGGKKTGAKPPARDAAASSSVKRGPEKMDPAKVEKALAPDPLADLPPKASKPAPKSEPPPKADRDPSPSTPPPSAGGHGAPSNGAAWGRPFATIERGWTWFEVRLLLFVILTLILAMVSWISLKGLSVPIESGSKAGTMFRAILGGVVLAAIAHQVQKRAKLAGKTGPIAVVVAMSVGFAIAPLWRSTGVDYFGRMLNWLQEGSSLTMFGGLRGVSTRLTIILAMIGSSLAAASGKHISIDALLRFLSPKLRIVTFVLSTTATMAVCVAASWGFVDYISIESFAADKDATRGEKVAHVQHHVSQDLFLWRAQVGLDLEALPRVLGGGKWDDETRMNGRQWNQFVEESGYRDHFEKKEVDALLAPPEDLDAARIPMVVVPEGSPRGLLVHVLNLAFPIGLIVIALRLLLRIILVLSGHDSVEVEGEVMHGPAADRPVVEPDEASVAAPEPEEQAAAADEPNDEPEDDPDAKPASEGDEGKVG